VVLMTSGRFPLWEASGAAGLLRKPFDIGDLVETVRRHLNTAA
jgi:hypothetical protein